jgi:hypothetical protein
MALLIFRILSRILISAYVEIVFPIIFIRTTKLFTFVKKCLDFLLILADSDIGYFSRNFLVWGISHLDYQKRNFLQLMLSQVNRKFHPFLDLQMKIYLILDS